MGSELHRLKKSRAAYAQLERLFQQDKVFVVHYSCESFFKRNDGSSIKIASISVKNLKSSTTRSFSIHHYAEVLGYPPEKLSVNYEKVEKAMLKDFFTHVSEYRGWTWAHWNMRNINFGFQAIEHRYRVLGGNPCIIEENDKFDVADILQKVYGPNYSKKPMLVNVCSLNEISSDLFLSGADEAESFERSEYLKLHQSTQKKVDFISYIAELALEKRLKTQYKWYKLYGYSPKVIVELLKDHWVIVLIGLLLTATGFAGLLDGVIDKLAGALKKP